MFVLPLPSRGIIFFWDFEGDDGSIYAASKTGFVPGPPPAKTAEGDRQIKMITMVNKSSFFSTLRRGRVYHPYHILLYSSHSKNGPVLGS
ncbi:hypothetical protein YWY31_52680 [Paenibacillus illinoisensis]